MGEIIKREEYIKEEKGFLVIKAKEKLSSDKWKVLAAKLKAAFPDLEKEFLVILFNFLVEAGVSNKRAEKKVNEVILTCKRLPRVADFIDNIRVKLYTYQEMQDFLWNKYKSDWIYYQNEFKNWNGYYVLEKEYKELLLELL